MDSHGQMEAIRRKTGTACLQGEGLQEDRVSTGGDRVRLASVPRVSVGNQAHLETPGRREGRELEINLIHPRWELQPNIKK